MSIRHSVIVNPAAGRGRARRLLPKLEAALARHGVVAEIVVSNHEDELRTLTEEAIKRGARAVACGGDGTVSHIAAAAHELGGVFGVIPAGAGNDFARQLGLDPNRPLDAIRALSEGDVGRVDSGRVDGRIYLNVAAIGFDAAANAWANGVRWLTGSPLYIAAMVRTLATYRPRRYVLEVDGAGREVVAWLIAVAKGPSYGGGMRIAPTARLDDATLTVVVVGPLSRPDLLRTFPKVYRGTHVDHPAVDVLTAMRLRISCIEEEAPPVYADGEPAGALPALFEAVPGAVRVVMARGGVHRNATA